MTEKNSVLFLGKIEKDGLSRHNSREVQKKSRLFTISLDLEKVLTFEKSVLLPFAEEKSVDFFICSEFFLVSVFYRKSGLLEKSLDVEFDKNDSNVTLACDDNAHKVIL